MGLLRFKDFILESRIHFFPEFESIIYAMKSPMAKKMVEIHNKDVDTFFNYLNISDRNDLVSFIPDNKVIDNNVEYKFVSMPYYMVDSFQIREIFGDISNGGRLPKIGTVGYIDKVIKRPENGRESMKLGILHGQVTSDICRFVTDSGSYIVLFENLEDQNKLMTDIKSTSIKVGRLVRSFFTEIGVSFPDSEYDKFVTEYKATYDLMKDKFSNFEVVSGEDIRTFYSESKYDKTHMSTLQNSCMRYEKCQRYFDIYVSNIRACNMVIRRSFINNELITARALLWKLSDGKTMMDRVYYSKEQEQNIFESWAIENGYYYQNRDGDFMFNGSLSDIEPEVALFMYEFDFYPFMDTLKYLDMQTGILYENVDSDLEDRCYFLEDQYGGPNNEHDDGDDY